jgi:hypothetical protein
VDGVDLEVVEMGILELLLDVTKVRMVDLVLQLAEDSSRGGILRLGHGGE